MSALQLVGRHDVAFERFSDETQADETSREVAQQVRRESVLNPERFQEVVKRVLSSMNHLYTEFSYRGEILKNLQVSTVLSLGDLRATDGHPLQKKLVKKLELTESIRKINACFPFFERLQTVSYDVLDQVPLFSLQMVRVLKDPTKSIVMDALIDDEALIETQVRELEGRNDLKVFTFRMNRIYQERSDLLGRIHQAPFKSPWWWQSLELSVAKLRSLSAEDISSICGRLPAGAFGLLTEDQIRLLDFSKLSSSQIVRCIQGGIDDKETIQRRFSVLSLEQSAVVFKKVPDDFLSQLRALIPASCSDEKGTN